MFNPGWVDLQVNGHKGVDYSDPALTADDFIRSAEALFADGTVTRALGWKAGEFDYDLTPAVFESIGGGALRCESESHFHLSRWRFKFLYISHFFAVGLPASCQKQYC